MSWTADHAHFRKHCQSAIFKQLQTCHNGCLLLQPFCKCDNIGAWIGHYCLVHDRMLREKPYIANIISKNLHIDDVRDGKIVEVHPSTHKYSNHYSCTLAKFYPKSTRLYTIQFTNYPFSLFLAHSDKRLELSISFVNISCIVVSFGCNI